MRVVIAIPILILLVAFALSNEQAVSLGLWPTDIQLEVPLSLAILVAGAAFFIMGAFMAWGETLAARSRARRAERRVRSLDGQVETMRQELEAAQRPRPMRSDSPPRLRSDVAMLPRA